MNPQAMIEVPVPTPVVRHRVTVNNPQGLHLRPAAAFAQLARQHQGQVTVTRHDRAVNGKSQLDLLLLAAEAGTELEVAVTGDNAESIAQRLADLLASPSLDDELPDPDGAG